MPTFNDLLHEEAKWQWSDQHLEAAQRIKSSLTSTETLTHYDPNLPISLACDACSVGVGTVIFHTQSDGKEQVDVLISKNQALQIIYL